MSFLRVFKAVLAVEISVMYVKFFKNDGFWSDTALLSSPTPPPVPKHRYRTEGIETIETRKQTEFGLKLLFFFFFQILSAQSVFFFFALKSLSFSEFSTTATTPEFIRPFQNEYTANEGENFKMECLMVGNPRPKVSWYYNDRPLNVNTTFCRV